MLDENAKNRASTHYPVLKSMKQRSKKLNDNGVTTKNVLDIPIRVITWRIDSRKYPRKVPGFWPRGW